MKQNCPTINKDFRIKVQNLSLVKKDYVSSVSADLAQTAAAALLLAQIPITSISIFNNRTPASYFLRTLTVRNDRLYTLVQLTRIYALNSTRRGPNLCATYCNTKSSNFADFPHIWNYFEPNQKPRICEICILRSRVFWGPTINGFLSLASK